MDVTQIRLQNLRDLKQSFEESEKFDEKYSTHGSQARFAAAMGISRAYISHMLNGRRGIGHAMARTIETALNLPDGWMDANHNGGEVRADGPAMDFATQVMGLYKKWPEEMTALVMNFAMQKALAADVPAEEKKNGAR